MDTLTLRKGSPAPRVAFRVLLVILISAAVLPIRPARADDTKGLIAVTKQVIRAAAKWGLEEAGTRIMGSAWHPFKAVISPVITELERRYPGFFLLDTAPKEPLSANSQLATKHALNAIDQDAGLQRMIVEGFNRLEKGQYEIKQQIEKISVRLDALNVSIDGLARSNDQKFDEVLGQLARIQQQLDQGRSVGFANKKVLFPLAFELPKDSVEAYVTLFIAGLEPIELWVNKNRPQATVNVSVPGPGIYAYHLNHREITTLLERHGNEFEPVLSSVSSANSGRVNIVPNAVYELKRLIVLGGAAGNKITMHLTKILTPEEEKIQDKEAEKFFERWEQELREEKKRNQLKQ